MCGITGFFRSDFRENEYSKILTKMAENIIHRGPDDGSYWYDLDSKIGLAHRRLSILDVSKAGAQPMKSVNERYVISYNGEIYNHIELRQELLSDKLVLGWNGSSDTETLLAGFENWGIKSTLKKCIGMFALAVWDKQERILTLARDRIGEKPLYYGWQGNTFLFGSELKSFYPHPEFKKEINTDALNSLLRYYNVSAPISIYKGIYKLRPGSILSIKDKGSKMITETYWSVKDNFVPENRKRNYCNDTDILNDFEKLMLDAVGKQMISDVPLGAFLSGGIDSSLIVAMMQSQTSSPIKTFTIGFQEEGYNEAEYAKVVAKHLQTDHTELYVSSQDALDVIPKLPEIYDEPFADSSQIPTYLVSKLASNSVKVSLSGDGGDELFSGYNRYLMADKIWNKMKMVPIPIRKGLSSMLSGVSPASWDNIANIIEHILPKYARLNNLGDKFNKGIGLISSSSIVDLYLWLVTHWDKPTDLVLNGKDLTLIEYFDNHNLENFDNVQGMMCMDLLTFLPDDLLVKIDRAAMAVSLETRAPFLDHRLIEFSLSLSQKYKVRNGNTKWLLKEVLKKYLPKETFHRPKTGFAVPVGQWLRGPLKEWADSLLNQTRLKSEGYFNYKIINEKWDQHINKTHNWDYHLWDVLMFQAWLENQKNNRLKI